MAIRISSRLFKCHASLAPLNTIGRCRIHRYVPLSGCFHRLDPGPGHYKGTSAPIGTFGTTSRRQNCGLPVPPPGSNILRSKWDDVTVPDDVTVTEFIRSVCNSRPEKVAFINPATEETVTFGELHRAIHSIMSVFAQKAVRKGEVVCLCAPNSIELAVSLLAIPGTGAVASPINPTLSPGEITKMLEDSRPTYLITTTDLLPKFDVVRKKRNQLRTNTYILGQAGEYQTIEGDLLGGGCNAEDSFLVHGHMEPKTDPAFLFFSSGTTGLPKAVQLTHYNIIASIVALGAPSVGFLPSREETLVTIFPLYHVGGLGVCLLALLYIHATQIIMPAFDFVQFLKLNEKHTATAMIVPPPVSLRLSKDPVVKEHDLSSVKVILSGAAPISDATQRRLCELLEIRTFKQLYGMTEVTCISHVEHPTEMKPGSAGRLVPNMQSKVAFTQVVDPDSGETLRPADVGEICLKGPQVMKGYAHLPEATNSAIDRHGWLHTGDIGYYDDEDCLYIVDRLKDLIKYKGHQVAPAELEATLLTHPDVVDAAVFGRADETAGEVPRAFVVLKPEADEQIAPETIKAFVAERVAPFKQLRGGVRVVKVIPKLASGKILRRQLRLEDTR